MRELKVREAELADRYAQGVSHLDQERWQQAVEVFAAIEQEQPGYRDTAALLRTAQQSLAAAQEAEAKKQAAPPPQNPPVVTHVKSKDHGGGEVSLSFADRPLTDLNALIDPTTPLSREQQHQILDRQQAGLRSDDREQRIAQRLLGSFSSRDDLYQDVASTAASLLDAARRHAESPDVSQTHKATTVAEDSPEAAAAIPPSTETASPAGRSNAQESKLPPSVEDLTAVELPANTTPARAKVRGFQRLNRRTKIAMGAAAIVLAAVGGWGIWHNTVQNQPENQLESRRSQCCRAGTAATTAIA